MRWKTHVLTAWLLFLPVAILNKYQINDLIIFAFFLFLGALIPDLDTNGKIKHSHILGNLLPLIAFISNLLLLPTKIIGWQKHREMTHSLLGMVIIGGFWGFLVSYFNLLATQGILLGYFAHIFSDSLTKSGIPAFFPVKTRLRGIFRTGGWSEMIYLILLVLYAITIFYFKIQNLEIIFANIALCAISTAMSHNI